MKLVGLMLVRNEDWCLGLTLRAALMWCDAMVVLLHNSVDDSRDIVFEISEEHPGRVEPILQLDHNWNEMQHRQLTLGAARVLGATHIAIIDADEILTGNLLPTRDANALAPPGIPAPLSVLGPSDMMQLPLYNLRGSVTRYHANGIWGNRLVSVAFADDPRALWGGDTFHRREPRDVRWMPFQPVAQGQGGVMHLWGVNERRLRAKHALYKLVERLRWPDKPVGKIDSLYSLAIHGDPSNPLWATPETWIYNAVPPEWWKPYVRWFEFLHEDSAPWQEKEVRRLLSEHPGIGRGLDLFGVA